MCAESNDKDTPDAGSAASQSAAGDTAASEDEAVSQPGSFDSDGEEGQGSDTPGKMICGEYC